MGSTAEGAAVEDVKPASNGVSVITGFVSTKQVNANAVEDTQADFLTAGGDDQRQDPLPPPPPQGQLQQRLHARRLKY